MIGAQPKRKNPETGKVDADYNFSDVKTIRKNILEFCTAYNSTRNEGEPHINPHTIIRTAMRRIAKHNGLNNKYIASGNLRE